MKPEEGYFVSWFTETLGLGCSLITLISGMRFDLDNDRDARWRSLNFHQYIDEESFSEIRTKAHHRPIISNSHLRASQ